MARKLAWAVGVPRHLKVYRADGMIWPVAGRGRPRKRYVSDVAEDMLADAAWKNISWRTGTKQKLKARFAAVREKRSAAPADFASRAPRHPRTHRSTNIAAMPALSKMDLQHAAA
jgi:hypothetical protein